MFNIQPPPLALRIALYQLPHYRETYGHFLNDMEGIKVVGTFSELAGLERQVHLDQPNIVLIDVAISGSFEVFRRIKKVSPITKVIVFTDRADGSVVLKSLRHGVDGYLLIKSTSLPRLREYLVDALHGGMPMSPDVMTHVVKAFAFQDDEVVETEVLTSRECQVLQLLVKGQSYKGISTNLDIALDTVRSHIKNIYEKLGVNSKSEAVVKALKEGMAVA